MMRHAGSVRSGTLQWALAVGMALGAGGAAAAAPVPGGGRAGAGATTPAERSAETFDQIVDHIGRAVDSGAWKAADWKKTVGLDEALADLMTKLRAATGRDDLAVPIELADVEAAEDEAPGMRLLPGSLLVCRDGSVGFATRAVILADGGVDVAHAQECVIVARGAVSIAHGSRNVVVAGHYVHVSHDGNARGDERKEGARANWGSVLVSGGHLDVSHATGTVVCGPKRVSIGHARGVAFVNSPHRDVSHEKGSKEARLDGARLVPPEKPNPLADRLRVTRVIPGPRGRGSIKFEWGAGEATLAVGEEMRDGKGQVIPELKGWRLVFVSEGDDGFALLSNGREDAAFVLDARGR